MAIWGSEVDPDAINDTKYLLGKCQNGMLYRVVLFSHFNEEN